MAYLLTQFYAGGTEEQYRATIGVLHAAGLPEGQRWHIGASTDGGFMIAALWESSEMMERFVADVVMPNMPIAGGFEAHPEQRLAEVVNLETGGE